jgi:hypothetical protein
MVFPRGHKEAIFISYMEGIPSREEVIKPLLPLGKF